MSFARFLITVAALALLLPHAVTCTPRKFNSANIAHNLNNYVTSQNPTNWIEPPMSEHIRTLQEPNAPMRVLVDHPAVQHLQEWVNAMDSIVRRSIPGQNSNVPPKPKVVIVDDADENAWVSGALVVYPARVIIPGNSSKTTEVDNIFISSDEVLINTVANLAPIIPVVMGNPQLLAALVERQRATAKKLGYKCIPELTNSTEITLRGCQLPPDSGTLVGKYYGSIQTSNILSVNRGLAVNMPEDQIVFAVAHELGHYYAAHATEGADFDFSFFYDENEAKQGKRPTPITDPAKVQLGQLAVNVASKELGVTLPGAKIDPRVILGILRTTIAEKENGFKDFQASNFLAEGIKGSEVLLTAIIDKKCRLVQKANPAPCDAFAKLLSDPQVASVLLNSAPLSQDLYDKITNTFMQATAGLNVGAFTSPPSVLSADIPVEDLFYSSLVKLNPVTGWTCRMAINTELGHHIPVPLINFVTKCNEWIVEIRKLTRQLTDQAILANMGWYTTEQHADSVGAELVSNLGLSPRSSAITGIWNLYKFVFDKSTTPFEHGVSYSNCQELAQGDFGFGTGSIRAVSLGDWSDVHHNYCYRIFNLVRELYAHNYVADASARPKFATNWPDIVGSLKSVQDGQPLSPESKALRTARREAYRWVRKY